MKHSLVFALFSIVIFMICLARGGSGQTAQSRQFKSRDEFFEAHKKEVIERLGLQPLDEKQEFDRMVKEEMLALDRVAGFRTIVTKGEGDQIASQPEAGIIISPSQLDFIRKRSGVTKFQQVLRFLLAHEKSHQVQYLEYSARSVHLGPPELRRVYECQADILAGKYLIESFGEPKPEDQPAIEDALQVAFDLGTEAFSDASTYPSHNGRRTAVRLGMTAGLITLLSAHVPDPPAVQMINSLSGKANIRQGETVMIWSLRLAKKITHFTLDAWSKLSLDDRKIEWDKNPQHPIVTFSLAYKNTSTRTIAVDMEVQCVAADRSDPENAKYWQKWSAQNFIFSVGPGETHLVQGRLQWYGDPKFLPVLIFPPKDTALMSARFID